MNNDFEKIIAKELQISIDVNRSILGNDMILNSICNAADTLIDSLRKGGKILLCGNGGSASDALHIAGELLGRFQKERKSYAAVALNADVATMTAIANDFGYCHVFSRQVEGLMNKEDVLVGLSTSGNSINIIKAFEQAKINGGKTILLSGENGGKLKEIADISIMIPSNITSHVQEAHTCIYHIFCEIVERALL